MIIYMLRYSIYFQHVKSGRGRVVSLRANFLSHDIICLRTYFKYVMGGA